MGELDAAWDELRRGDVGAATQRLEALREQRPDDARVATALARTYLKAGRTDAAVTVAEEATRLAPSSASALTTLGLALKERRDLAEAEAAFQRARAAGETPFVSSHLARLMVGRGAADEALAVCLGALRRNPDDPSLLELKGDILAKLGRHDEAEAAFQAAQELQPDSPHAHKRLLEARLRKLPREEAIEELQRLAEVPTYAGRAYVHELLGRWLHDAGRSAEAVPVLERALELDPESRFLPRLLGFAYAKAGDAERAVEQLRPFFLADPADHYVRGPLLAGLRRLKRGEEALALVDQALASHPRVKALHGVRRKVAAWADPDRATATASRGSRSRQARAETPRRERSAEEHPALLELPLGVPGTATDGGHGSPSDRDPRPGRDRTSGGDTGRSGDDEP